MVKVDVIQEKGKGRKHNMIMVLACRFFADCLMTRKEQKGVKVTVVIDPDKLHNRVLGVVYEPDGSTKPYMVVIKSEMTLMQKVKVLAHEMVHVRQYATGQLQTYYIPGDVRELEPPVRCATWHGSRLGPFKDIPYMARPWEQEAFAMEKGLMQTWEEADL